MIIIPTSCTISKTSILLSDVSIEGDLIEKDKIILDAKVNGDIKAEDIETHPNSFIKGNIKSKNFKNFGNTFFCHKISNQPIRHHWHPPEVLELDFFPLFLDDF